jgi:hypothetical protein
MPRSRIAILAACAVVALPDTGRAVPPAVCRQTLRGIFRADDGRTMPVVLRLRMRSDENDLSFRGKFRCVGRGAACFVDATTVDGFGLDAGRSLLAQSTKSTVLLRRNGDGTFDGVCTLEATTPYVRDLCIPALGGTFACPADGAAASVEGAFGLAVESCLPCRFGPP